MRYVQEEGKEGVLSRAGCSRQRLLLGRADQTTDKSADDASQGG